MKINDSIEILKGVGPKTLKLLNNLGIFTIEDLLYHYPNRYEDSSKILKLNEGVPGEKGTFKCRILKNTQDRRIRKGLYISTFLIEDETARASLIFFNNRFIGKSIHYGEEYLVYGKFERFKGLIQISSPEIERLSEIKNIGRIRAIYPLTKGINNNLLEKLFAQVLPLNLFENELPKDLRDKYGLMEKNIAIENIHRPSNRKAYIRARNTLIYEELFFFELSILQLKNNNIKDSGIKFEIHDEVFDLIKNLPFKLTSGQEKVLDEIFKDMEEGRAVNRLLQGDVGSGKTIVTVILSYLAKLNGYQSAIMAPTEILATQHFQSFRSLLESRGVHVRLLVGSTSPKIKEEILNGLKNGLIDILIGTHAIIEENVEFYKLGLNVIDEQHRFGVIQRKKLQEKNRFAANIVMSATPIPRSLSLILYADLDLSVIDTMPMGRKKIKTLAINSSQEKDALNFIGQELKNGRQAYVICSLIEENENLENLEAVEDVYEKLKSFYKDFNVALLHGRLTGQEKNRIMEDFKENKIQLIVSTTVIEVGINVANASVIMVYNAERFGLATLHQLRGRVGRGSYQSYCILYNKSKTEISWQRMKILTDSQDGFYIANKDMELRGFGDILGTRQSGLPNLRLANPLRDINILKYAHEDAGKYLDENNNTINIFKNESKKLNL